jgi:hypothetical protein
VQDLYDRVSVRYWEHRQRKATIDHVETQNKLHQVRIIAADERGRFPLLYGENGVIRDPNALRSFTLDTVLERWPYLEDIDARIRALIAAQGIQTPSHVHYQVGDQVVGAATELGTGGLGWPASVGLAELLRGRRASIHDLIVGARPGPGGLEVVSDSLHNLMHTLEVGASGWGKSVWLRSFLYQIAKASEPCEVVAIDTNGSEFNLLRQWSRLRFPVAREDREAVVVLGKVSEEIARRKGLYERHPLVTKLTEYNEATGVDLPPWVVAIDEGTNLLNQPGIGEPLRAAVQTARQYGIYILLAGQSAKHSVIDTQVRDNFSTRLCFRTSPTSSRVVLDDRAAGDLKDKGRAICQLTGREQLEIQGPFVSREDFLAALQGDGPQYQMPVGSAPLPPIKGPTPADVAQVIKMHQAGESKRAIQRGVFGYEGGAAYSQVTDIIGGITTTDTAKKEKMGEKSPSTTLVVPPGRLDFCDFCGRSAGQTPGEVFSTCAACGVGVCSGCAVGGLCPDCRGGE